jgi:uncharacterized protein YgiM (DUF1202 family)
LIKNHLSWEITFFVIRRKTMKNQKSILMILLSLLLAAMLLSACSSGDATETPTVAPTEVPTEMVEPTDEPVDILPTAAPGEATLTANENVRVRSGPSQQYPVYKNMAGGETAKLLGVSTDGTYYAIDVPVVSPNTGWVDANFATISNADSLPVIEAPPVPPTAEFVGVQEGDPTLIATDAIFVHSGPGDKYPAYGVAEAGSKGLAIGVSEDGNWWVVRINPDVVGEGNGWIQKELVTTENVGEDLQVIKTPPLPETGELPPPDTNGPYGIATDYLNVRSGPGTNYAVLGVVAPSASGEIVGKSADGAWWQFKISTNYSPDGVGWGHSAYINAYNTEGVPVVEAPPASTAPPPTNPDLPEGSYSCILVSQDPVDETIIQAGAAFDMVWEVQNVGTETWTVADTLVTKVGAEVDQPLSSVDSLPLSNDVSAGSNYVITVPMTAPGFAGTFGEYWNITLGDQIVCYFYNVIQVQE